MCFIARSSQVRDSVHAPNSPLAPDRYRYQLRAVFSDRFQVGINSRPRTEFLREQEPLVASPAEPVWTHIIAATRIESERIGIASMTMQTQDRKSPTRGFTLRPLEKATTNSGAPKLSVDPEPRQVASIHEG